MEYIKELTADLSGEMLFEFVVAVQGDNGRRIKVILYANNQKYTIPTGATAILRAKKPDGTMIFNDCTIAEDSTIIADLTQQTLAVCGNVRCQISLYSDAQDIITSVPFIIKVTTKTALDSEIKSTNEFNAISDAQSIAITAREIATQVLSNVETVEARVETVTTAAEAATETATTAAEAATETATTAIEAAESATEAATTAAEAAESATEAANTATENAAEAVKQANQIYDNIRDEAAKKIAEIKTTKGLKGDTGDTGYTPIRGRDYWTADDITAIDDYIDNSISRTSPIIINTEQAANVLTVIDGLDRPITNIGIYGNSTQDGAPSIDNPIPVVNSGVYNSVTNKFDYTVTYNGDKTFVISLDEPLRKVGNVCDDINIDFKTKTATLTRRIYSVLLRATGLYRTFTNVIRFSYFIGVYIYDQEAIMNTPVMCNRLKNVYGFTFDSEIIFWHNMEKRFAYFSINKSRLAPYGYTEASTDTEAKEYCNQFLVDNPMTMQYQLLTPTIIDISDSIDWDNININTTYDTDTIITINGGINTDVSATYYADTKKYIDKKFDALTAALLSE